MTNECYCLIVSAILCAAALVDDYELLVLSFDVQIVKKGLRKIRNNHLCQKMGQQWALFVGTSPAE